MNDKLDLALFRVLKITLETDNYLIKWSGDALAYYINSGRAPTPWVKAFTRADTKALLEHMASGHDHSDKAMIKRADTYIRRHHRVI